MAQIQFPDEFSGKVIDKAEFRVDPELNNGNHFMVLTFDDGDFAIVESFIVNTKPGSINPILISSMMVALDSEGKYIKPFKKGNSG